MSFYEAEAFCKWAGGRLPTEQEWEAAAGGPNGLEYPWGNEWKIGICNSSEAGLGRTSPVGLFPASRSAAFGLEDIAGNVWEWCADWYDKVRDGRVVRGGSFYVVALRMRCSVRTSGFLSIVVMIRAFGLCAARNHDENLFICPFEYLKKNF